MGTLFYDSMPGGIDIDDRTLAHLKIVITTKLRRGESFALSWAHPAALTGGRTTIWLHPAIPLRFEFDDDTPPAIDHEWIARLAEAANSIGGVRLLAEHFGHGADDQV